MTLPLSPMRRGVTPRSGGKRLMAVAQRRRAGLIPFHDDGVDYGATADHVVVEDDQPTMVPIGVLDPRGVMLIRVTTPIKQQMGFNTGGNAWCGGYPESISEIVPADMLQVSDIGLGRLSYDISEVERPLSLEEFTAREQEEDGDEEE